MAGSGSQGVGSLFRVGDNVSLSVVLLFLSLFVLIVVILEQLLHKLEHKGGQSYKYDEMLRKTYRELMVFGLVGFALKLAKEVATLDAYSTPVIAFQVADLAVFILALALILQAISVFIVLRRKDNLLDRAELINSNDLADIVASRQQAEGHWTLIKSLTSWHKRLCGTPGMSAPGTDAAYREMAQLRILRHLFLRQYGLPELFPFAKYIRQAQDNQITHMIDVDISMWVVLLAVGWALNGVAVFVGEAVVDIRAERHSIAVAFVCFAWALVILHLIVDFRFRWYVLQLLLAGGYSGRPEELPSCLRAIGQEELLSLSGVLAGDAIKAMQSVQERQEMVEREKERQRPRHALVADDAGLQLLLTGWRHLKAACRGRSDEQRRMDAVHAVKETPDQLTRTLSYDATSDTVSQVAVALAPLPRFHRKAWHCAVMFLMMLNGFYLALLCHCVMYQLHDIAHSYGFPAMLCVPLPVAINIFVLQPPIFRKFMLICSIARVDSTTLSEVVTHFSEIVELRSEFISILLTSMRAHGHSSKELCDVLHARDKSQSGTIELELLREVFHGFGFRLSQYRFTSVARLLFRLRGTSVEYSQVLRMLALAECEQLPLQDQHHLHGCHLLLRQTVITTDDKSLTVTTGAEEKSVLFTTIKTTSDESGSQSERRTPSQLPGFDVVTEGIPMPASTHPLPLQLPPRSLFLRTSSRTLHSLYHNDCMDSVVEYDRTDIPGSPVASAYLEI